MRLEVHADAVVLVFPSESCVRCWPRSIKSGSTRTILGAAFGAIEMRRMALPTHLALGAAELCVRVAVASRLRTSIR